MASGYGTRVEHVERQNEREDEIAGQVEQLDEQGDELEGRSEDLGEQIDETREEWQTKQRSDDVPGAQPPGGHGTGEEPPPEADITPGDEDELTG